MSKLTAIHKQIAALQAEAERITKQEMSTAIAKVKGLMSEFGLTIGHLTQSVVGKPAAKKTKAAKAKTASAAKYADPKTGKTWSGFGRAPGWIAGAKNRDAFLVDKSSTKAAEPAVKAPAAARKTTVKVAKTVKVSKKAAKPASKKVAAATKKATAVGAAPAAPKKKPAIKKSAVKKAAAKKAVAKKTTAPKGAAASSTETSAVPAA